ncbi:MAG TPA: flagellar basal body P-ring formation chaperone FlgA [Candidatus Sulfotelmatobacter sp.]|nr:flagellar basal body P-ring formation chaperone FlgA [Candidatus Sulfotelmatobacter sp.]
MARLLLNASRMEVRFYSVIALLAVSWLSASAGELQLNAVAAVSGDGVYLPQLFSSTDPLPVIKLCDAPAFGQSLSLSREKICGLLSQNAPACPTNFTGPDEIKISRRARTFGESDVLGLLTARLQNDYIKDRGQLELHLAQPWSPLVLPDEPLTLDVQDIPSLGVSPNFMVRFSLRTANETLGTWTANLHACVWREVCVASRQLTHGEPVTPQVFARERRDVLNIRENIADLSSETEMLETAEDVPAGGTILERMLKPLTVIHRGQSAEALVQDGSLSVKTKVQILDDGAPGEIVRARNTASNRDLTGKVLDAKTILVSL